MQPLFVFFLLVYDAIIIFIKYIFEIEFKAWTFKRLKLLEIQKVTYIYYQFWAN